MHLDMARRLVPVLCLILAFALPARAAELAVTITYLGRQDPPAIPLSLVYVDDATRRAPPEVPPGSVPLVGISGRHGEKLEAGRYGFQLRVIGLAGYQPGDERRELDRVDAPLTASVSRPAALAGEPAAPR